MTQQGPVRSLFDSFTKGDISRRDFVQRLSALGIGAAGISLLAETGVAAQDASAVVAQRPDSLTDGQERGGGGHLNILQWQSASHLSPHTATGTKDFLGAMLVVEPLMLYLPDASRIPNLITEVPSIDAGTLAEDLTWVDMTLVEGLKWNDGEPVTAEDIKFTVEWVQNPDNNSTNRGTYQTISGVEIVDDLSVRVTFTEPNPFWWDPFCGTSTGFLYPKHVLEVDGAHEAFMSKPVGTGPYKVDSFTAADQAEYSINEHYREANKPFFSTVTIKGGGDAAAAARAVLQTGEYDFAWKLQVEPDVLNPMAEAADATGKIVKYPGVTVERINLQFADPWTEVDGQRAEMNTPHPILSDHNVRRAMALAIDRQTIADRFYGNGQQPAQNIINGDAMTDSPNTEYRYDPEEAAAILEEAGWVMDGSFRKKDGVELKLVYATSVNAVRQKTQAVAKAGLEAVGFRVELEQIDAGLYFDGTAGNDQNINHFYWDLDMYQSVPNSPRPINLMQGWYAGPNGENVAQKSNGWSGLNFARYINEEYDAAWEGARAALTPEELADYFITMNDIVINDVAIIPLVVAGEARGASNRMNQENFALAAFGYDYWNIANWNLAE